MRPKPNRQTAQEANDRAGMRLSFANRESARRDEFGRVLPRISEADSNAGMAVWHDFSLSSSTVRKVGTSGSKNVIKCVP